MIKIDVVCVLVRNLKDVQVLKKKVCVGCSWVMLGSSWVPLVTEPALCVVGDVFQMRPWKRFACPRPPAFSWFVCESGFFLADFQLQQCRCAELRGWVMGVSFR